MCWASLETAPQTTRRVKMKSILIGLAIGLLVVVLFGGHWGLGALIFALACLIFVDRSGDGDGRQQRSRDR
jgi:hypothetical protein